MKKPRGMGGHKPKGWMPILAVFVAALLIVDGMAGCGYQFRVEGAGPTIGGQGRSATQGPAPRLAVKTLVNRSFEPNLETRYTNYVRYEFSTGSGAQVVPDSDAADLVLSGEILSVSMPTLSFSQTATTESRTEVVLRLDVEDVKTRKKIWSQAAKGASEFFVTRDLQFNRVLQNRALEQAGRFAAADLAGRFLLYLESGGWGSPRNHAEPPTSIAP
ncbi:MAG: LPS assembly lipoprotein LptE [Nitrospira sp.]|nr:LPS assembly lipoprotein LptE [Nitrospira sp.]